MVDAVTALQMWAPLIGATIAALAGMRSWRIVGHTEGVVQSLEKSVDRIISDVERNRESSDEHSEAIRALTVAVSRFDGIPRLIKQLQDKIDDISDRLDDGGRNGRRKLTGPSKSHSEEVV